MTVLAMGGEVLSDSQEVFECARPGCNETFEKKSHNQKYHNNECCKLATNAKIMEKYYERRAQRLGKTRLCSSCGVTKLSRYNDSRTCSGCDSKSQVARNNSVLDMLNAANLV